MPYPRECSPALGDHPGAPGAAARTDAFASGPGRRYVREGTAFGAAAGPGNGWAAAGLKVAAALLPLFACWHATRRGHGRAVKTLAWAEAAVLTGYGLVLTAGGLLVQAGIIRTPGAADHRALAWHAYLWDPWFLVWGLLVAASLLAARYGTKGTPTRRGPHGNGMARCPRSASRLSDARGSHRCPLATASAGDRHP